MAISASELKAKFAKRREDQKTEQKPQPRSQTPRQRVETKAPTNAPPYSEEAEQAVLASIAVSPNEALIEARRSLPVHFLFVPAHRDIYQCFLDMWDSGNKIDLITFTQFVRDRGKLDTVGGALFVTNLFTSIDMGSGSAANILYYIDIIREKFLLREMIYTGTNMVRAAHGAQDDVPEMIGNFADKLDRIRLAAGGPNGAQRFGFSDLMGFDSKHDPNCLVGNRYLVRGSSSLWAAGSGYGKSSLALQLAVYWACGQSCFGLRPVRPLKSLFIQAENDLGDMGEQLQGVIGGVSALGDIDIESSKEQIEKNLGIHRAIGKTGRDFLDLLDQLVEIDRPDIAWIDPLFAFAGCDLLDAEKTGRFLRSGLFPIAAKRLVALNVIHHIGKPVRDSAKSDKVIAEIDYQYLGFGTSEIQNSFRAVNVIVPVSQSPGLFRMVLSKRGERAGARDIEGQWARSIYMRHSTEGICWLQAEAPQKKPSANLKYTGDDILEEMSVTTGMTAKTLQEHMKNECGMSEKTFYRLWKTLKKDGLITLDSDENWTKKP